MKSIYIAIIAVILGNSSIAATETLRWTGKGDGKSFWSTSNWAVGTTSTPPTTSQLSTTSPINFNLVIVNAQHTIGNNGTMYNPIFGTEVTSIQLVNSALGLDVYSKKGFRTYAPITIDLVDSYLGIDQLQRMTINIEGSSSLSIYESSTFSAITNSTVNLLSDDAWIGFRNIKSSVLNDASLSFIKVKGNALAIGVNVELIPYYAGTLIKVKQTNTPPPLTIYSQENLEGEVNPIAIRQIYSLSQIPLGNNNINSFRLRKGHMLTLAQNGDGTGMSKVFIAAEKDMVVNTLPEGLKNDVSFVRVIPWIYTNKRGVGWGARENTDYEAKLAAISPGWFYNWGANKESIKGVEYALMTWGKSASTATTAQTYIAKENVTHLLSFNEPDNVGQSNIAPEVAVESYKYMLSTGLRIGSPAPKEEGILNGWVPSFMEGCKNANYRVDFITVHWYDWSNWLSTLNPNPNIDQAVNRFKTYLQNVYNKYKLPIWITEFNVNDNRGVAAQKEFLEKVIPILESLDYIERYAFFNPGSKVADFVPDGNITEIGQLYRDSDHNQAIQYPYWASTGSFYDQFTSLPPSSVLLKNGDFEEPALNTGWTPYQYNTTKQTTAPAPQSGSSYLRLTGDKGDKYGTVTQVCELKPSTQYKLSFYAHFGGADASNTFNALYLGLKGYPSKDAADANDAATSVNLIDGGAPNYSINKGAGPLPSDTQWELHTVNLTTTESHQVARLNISKNFGVWNIDNVVLEELKANNIKGNKTNYTHYQTSQSTLIIQSPTTTSIAIYGLNGSLLLSTIIKEGNNTIPIAHLPKGCYVLRLKNSIEGSKSIKFVK